MKEYKITTADTNQRLNKFVGRYLSAAPQSFVYKMLRKKNITLNDKKATGAEMLNEGDVVKFFLADETIDKFRVQLGAKSADLEAKRAKQVKIAYEDENIIVAVKPKGLLSHPDKIGGASLIFNILGYLKAKSEYNSKMFTPALANRLDRNTTGLVMCGKNLQALQALNKMIKDKQLDKYYVAIVSGHVQEQGRLENYFVKDQAKNKIKIVTAKQNKDSDAELLLTEYTPISTFKRFGKTFTYIKLHLITGKPHQLRAHMAHIGHPIVGDPKYGNASVNKWVLDKFNIEHQMLHAQTIYFRDTVEPLSYLQGKTIEANLPKSFSEFLEI